MKLLREVLFGVALCAASALVVWGVAGWSENFAKITAGLLTAAVAYVFLAEAGR